jgi:hypothetical protein
MSEFTDVPVRELLDGFQEAYAYRKSFEVNWDRNEEYAAGDQWKGVKKRKWWESQPVFNKTFEYVEIVRALLADQRWGLDALPRTIGKDGDEADGMSIADKASKVNHLLDYVWDDARIQFHLAEALWHTFTKGTGILKATFDPDNVSSRGSGQIDVRAVNPKHIFPDPDATGMEDVSRLYERREVTWSYVLRRWPDKVDIDKLREGGYIDPSWNPTQGPNAYPRRLDSKTVDLLECWYFDETVEEIPESEREDADLGKWVYDVRKKYPDGRYTLMLGDGTVLDDKPNPYGNIPYTIIPEIPVLGQFWGSCTLDRLVPIQQTINVLAQSIIDNGLFLATGVWVIDKQSGINPKELPKQGAPGGVVVKEQGRQASRETGAQLPPHIFDAFKMAIDLFDRIGGLPDVLRGIVPSRQPVQTTMMQQEAGELRTRERARRVEDALSRLGLLIIDGVTRYWTDTRSYRRVKADGSLDVFELSKKDLAGWEFDIIVRPGSTLPLDRMFATQKAMEMRAGGIKIPDAYILKMSGLPGIEEVIADMAAQPMPTESEGGDVEPEAQMFNEDIPAEPVPFDEGMEADPLAALLAGGGDPALMGGQPMGEELLSFMG